MNFVESLVRRFETNYPTTYKVMHSSYKVIHWVGGNLKKLIDKIIELVKPYFDRFFIYMGWKEPPKMVLTFLGRQYENSSKRRLNDAIRGHFWVQKAKLQQIEFCPNRFEFGEEEPVSVRAINLVSGDTTFSPPFNLYSGKKGDLTPLPPLFFIKIKPEHLAAIRNEKIGSFREIMPNVKDAFVTIFHDSDSSNIRHVCISNSLVKVELGCFNPKKAQSTFPGGIQMEDWGNYFRGGLTLSVNEGSSYSSFILIQKKTRDKTPEYTVQIVILLRGEAAEAAKGAKTIYELGNFKNRKKLKGYQALLRRIFVYGVAADLFTNRISLTKLRQAS